jgi:prepilin-type N-terminal cleavage/methylation domain-containing protein
MRKLVKAIRRVYRGGEKGFTLIELLVVIGILAALAGVVTLGVTRFIGRGANEANCTELHNVQTAATACEVEKVKDGTLVCNTVAGLKAGGFLLTDPRCTSYTIAGGVITAQSCPSGTTMCAPSP